MFKLVDVGPDLGLPAIIMHPGSATGGATGVKLFGTACKRFRLKLNKDAADFFDIVIAADDMLVSQQIPETQLCRLPLGLGAGVERPVLGPQLLG